MSPASLIGTYGTSKHVRTAAGAQRKMHRWQTEINLLEQAIAAASHKWKEPPFKSFARKIGIPEYKVKRKASRLSRGLRLQRSAGAAATSPGAADGRPPPIGALPRRIRCRERGRGWQQQPEGSGR